MQAVLKELRVLAGKTVLEAPNIKAKASMEAKVRAKAEAAGRLTTSSVDPAAHQW